MNKGRKINLETTNTSNVNPSFHTSNNVVYNYGQLGQGNEHLRTKPIHHSDMQNVPFCSNCGKHGHIFKKCEEPIFSYGLICFYKTKVNVPVDGGKTYDVNGYKRTRKINEHVNTAQNVNQLRIKMLKRNGVADYTQKNNPTVVSTLNVEQPDVDGVVDVDMMNNYEVNDSEGDISANPEIEVGTQAIETKEISVNKVILVQRCNTIGFIEFIRGKYNVDEPEYIIKLLNMMTYDEKKLVNDLNDFDAIRNKIGLKWDANYRNEYDDAKRKFSVLQGRRYTDIDNEAGDTSGVQQLIKKSYTKWASPEWGLPKGRRNNKEYDIECAVREFIEETDIEAKNLIVYRNVKPLEEVYRGINGTVYKHIYYLAQIRDNEEGQENIGKIEANPASSYEINKIKAFTLNECHKIIRPYYVSKLNVIKKGFQLISSLSYFFE